MNNLKHDWLTEGLIDYEYKKYVLLAYLKDVGNRFNQSELYPFMTDLIFHYRNLIKVKESKKLMYDNFPESLTKADFNKLRYCSKFRSALVGSLVLNCYSWSTTAFSARISLTAF